MKRFQLFFLAASIAGASSGGFFLLTMPAQAKQCSSERPANARSYWSYRLIDGRKCWYEGKPMLTKSSLHWPLARARQRITIESPFFQRTFTIFSTLKLPSRTIPRVSKRVGVRAFWKQSISSNGRR